MSKTAGSGGVAPVFQQQARLLIVDDDALALRALEKTLRAEGYEVHTARSIADAKKLIDTLVFDAALIDLFLDDRQGADLVSDLRQGTKPCCATMITGTTRGDAARQAIAAGAEDFLIKPVQTELLFDSMRRTVEKTRLWRAQVARLDAVKLEPRDLPHLTVVSDDLIQGTADLMDSGPSGGKGKLLAWPPLPTLKALDIQRCADAIAELGGLTDRERRILVPLLRGEQNAEIAQSTGSSARTVKFHVSNILKKLRVTQRSELLRFFF